MPVKDKQTLHCEGRKTHTHLQAGTHAHTGLPTSFLHEAEEIIQKLFSLWVSVQFVELQKGRETHINNSFLR